MGAIVTTGASVSTITIVKVYEAVPIFPASSYALTVNTYSPSAAFSTLTRLFSSISVSASLTNASSFVTPILSVAIISAVIVSPTEYASLSKVSSTTGASVSTSELSSTVISAEAVMVFPAVVTAFVVKVYVPAAVVSRIYFPSATVTASPFKVYSMLAILFSRVIFTVKYASSPMETFSEEAVTETVGAELSTIISYSLTSDFPDQSKALTTTGNLPSLLGIVRVKLPSSSTVTGVFLLNITEYQEISVLLRFSILALMTSFLSAYCGRSTEISGADASCLSGSISA